MIRKCAALLLLLCLMLPLTAPAATEITETMHVTENTDWVSLRESPSTAAKRLVKVPAGATVTGCEKGNKEFVRCTYEGMQGYILLRYLQPVQGAGSAALQPVVTPQPQSTLGTLHVVNCENWVSLRKKPDSSSERLVKVPLGAYVTNCEPENDEYIYCEYAGKKGYIQSIYLEKASAEAQMQLNATPAPVQTVQTTPAETERKADIATDGIFSYVNMATSGTVVIDERQSCGDKTYYLFAVYQRDAAKEQLFCGCYDVNYLPIWGRTMTAPVSDLKQLEVFIGGTENDACILLYHAGEGLGAYDLATGNELWQLPTFKLDLGKGICYTVDKDGTIYIAGKKGPHPVAINREGGVLWMSEVADTAVYGPYRITAGDNGIITDYESLDKTGTRMHYQTETDIFGRVIDIRVTNIP